MGMIIRTIIILPILLVLILVALFFYPFAEPILAVADESAAVDSVWGSPQTSVMTFFGLSLALFVLGLFGWHLFAPIREDVHRRRF